MNLRIHNSSMTKLAELLGTTSEDCAAWIEELLTDMRGEPEEDEELFEKLGDNLYPEQVSLLSQQLIEHYSKEHLLNRNEIAGLIYNLKTN